MKRSLTVRIPHTDPAIVQRGSLPVITQQAGAFILIIGMMTDLAIVDDELTGTLKFTGPCAAASEELYHESTPRLSVGVCGICLTF